MGLAEDEATHAFDAGADHGGNSGDPLSSIAWQLATAAVAIRHDHAGKSKSPADPLETMRETSVLFRNLQHNPFGAVTEFWTTRRSRAPTRPVKRRWLS